MNFQDPHYLLLILILPIWLLIAKYFRRTSLRFSTFDAIGSGESHRESALPLWIRGCGLLLVVLALARPQIWESEREIYTRGIDIVMALDVSGSMYAEDFHPENRLMLAKEEAKRFIRGRKNDRIGLVVYAKKSFTQCPLTLDYEILINLLDQVHIGALKDGTAIGLGIANAVNRLRDSEAISKVIILLTDGENNSGNIDPLTAAELARKFNIKIYAIGIGKEGVAPFPVDDPIFGRRYIQHHFKIDERSLQKIADITGGQFFVATIHQS